MKVILVNPYFPPYAPGGAEYSLQLLCEHFASAGIEVVVLTNCFDGHPGVQEVNGYAVHYIDSPVILEEGQEIDASEYIFSSEYHESVCQALGAKLKTGWIPDVVIANNAPAFIPVARIGKELQVPTIGIVRDTQIICETGACIDGQAAAQARPCSGVLGAAACMLSFQRKRGARNARSIPGILYNGLQAGKNREALRRQGVYRLQHLITISDALRSLLLCLPAIEEKSVTTIGNFSTRTPSASQDEVYQFMSRNNLNSRCFFLVAGKKSYGKGSDLAALAGRYLYKKRADIKILFVGKGRVAEDPHPSFIDSPPVSQELLMGLLQHSFGLLIPGRWQEGLHRTLIDALRRGLPVISTQAGGPPENIINNLTGYVVPCDDAMELSRAMEALLQWDGEKLLLCRKNAQRIFQEKFSDQVLLDRWISQLRTIQRNRTGIAS